MQPPKPHAHAPEIAVDAGARPAPTTRHPHDPVGTAVDGLGGSAVPLLGTRDPRLVRAWATHCSAEPATGEATASGPATVSVNDQGSGLRFNFPGTSRFRPLTWHEWLAHFESAHLVFVFEAPPSPDDASAPPAGGAVYRIVAAADWGDRPLATLAGAPDAA